MKNFTYALVCTMLLFSTITSSQIPILEEARTGNKEAIKKRLENNENCAEKDNDGNNALHIAAQEGHTEIVDTLTTEPTYPHYDSRWFWSWLGYVPTLPDKNAKNKDGKVPMHCSIEQGHIETTEKLLEKDADPSITDKEGISPVFSTIKKNDPQFIPVLVKHKLIQQRKNGDNMLHEAITQNQFGMVSKLAEIDYLTNQENHAGKTPAMLAAEKKDPTALRILHSKGINLNSRSSFGRQPIHSAAQAGSYDAAKYLLENGADIDSTDNNDNTPLLLSTIEGKNDVVDLFLAYKADPKKRNKQGKDILALSVENQCYELIKRFKQLPDVNIDGRDNLGRTAFMNATIAKDHSMMSTLYNCGADIYIIDYEGENPLHKTARNGDTSGLSMLASICHSDFFNKVNYNGDSPVFIAIQNEHIDIIRMLLNAGISLERTNKNGETIFHQYAKCKNTKILAELINNPLSKANINAPANNGLSAMHYAAAHDNVAGMQELTKYGASYTDVTQNGDTLAHSAAVSGAVHSLQHLKHCMPMMLQQRNKKNHTPFIIAAQAGNLDIINFLFCENDIISRDIGVAINLARTHNYTHITQFLEQKEKNRMNECIKLVNQPEEIINTENQIAHLHLKITENDLGHLISYWYYESSSPKQYSVNELYYKTEAERTQISLEYTKIHNTALQKKMELEKKLNTLISQEQLKKENERIFQEQARVTEQKRILETHNRQEENRKRLEAEQTAALKKFNKENTALKEYKEQNDELKKLKNQQIELEHIAKQKKAGDIKKAQEAELKKLNDQKKELDNIAAQKAELDYYAQQKAKTNAVKHADALEKQQEYIPMNLQASAPPMEQEQQPVTCIVCHGKPSIKPLPCKKCKKKSTDICNTCFKQYGGQCSICWDEIGQFVKIEKGECCINQTNLCTEEKGVVVIPCNGCKKGSERICKACLETYIRKNKELKQPQCCPYCHANTMNETLIKEILAQKQ